VTPACGVVNVELFSDGANEYVKFITGDVPEIAVKCSAIASALAIFTAADVCADPVVTVTVSHIFVAAIFLDIPPPRLHHQRTLMSHTIVPTWHYTLMKERTHV
jgi:hypothetical protein